MRWLAIVALLSQAGCLKKIALTAVANTIAEPGSGFSRDDDPELVRDALPVLMKTMEQLHEALPQHRALLLAMVRAFTSYGVAFIEEQADRLQESNVEAARVLYARCRRMFLRARGYGLDGLELQQPGFRAAWERAQTPDDRSRALARMTREDVPLLYWTGAAWGSAVGAAKDDMKLVGELPKVEALERRALELDESYEEGAIHEFFITYGGAQHPDEAKQHLERALALSHHKKLAPLVSYAESVAVTRQDKKEFKRLLEEAAAFDVDSDPDHRLANIIAQRRARWLLSRTDELFAE
ncbi:MAG TPA: TRAP transporter TatT component family protein [Polyangia bacterium]|nr:TRAP transporter TatT component family protein [Polyangia bacterium]